jgi:hypothetical protein
MKVKKIYIDIRTSMEKWVDDNHLEIIHILYDNIFDFVRGDELRRIVLMVIAKPTMSDNNRFVFSGISYEFMLIRDNIDDTISALIKNFEEIEDYEKCYELLQLKNEM